MRKILTLALLLSFASSTAMAELQWQRQSAPQTPSEARSASATTRRVARFQRPGQAQVAPAEFEEAGSPVRQASHTTSAPRPTRQVKRPVKQPRRVAAQMARTELVPTPTPDPSPVSETPYGGYESYEGGASPVVEGPVMGESMASGPYCESCGPECGCACPEPSCGYLDVGCGFAEPGCGCYEPGCCCEDPSCCGDCCGSEVGCGDVCWSPWWGRCTDRGAVPFCIYLPPINHLTIFAGVQGFKGALDEYRDRGNFGFHQGANISGKMSWLPWPGLGYQVGYRATQNQLHGTSSAAPYDGSHSQHFLTAGLFRRNKVGFQYGVVYDFMGDDRVESTTFNQVRALISVTNCHGHEIGFTFAASDDKQDLTGPNAQVRQYEPVDQYLGFWRYHGCQGGDLRIFGGGGSGLGVLGMDINAPLNDSWSLSGGFTYYIPDGEGQVASQEEGWNIGMSLVWHYGCGAKRFYKSPWRPMFDVADNGSFYVDDLD